MWLYIQATNVPRWSGPGFQASTLLEAAPETRSIPIVAVTASITESEEEKVAAVCDGLLRNPIAQPEFIHLLSRFLKHSTAPFGGACLVEGPSCDEDAKGIYDPEGLKEKIELELGPLWEQTKRTAIVNQVVELAERTIAIASMHKDSRLSGCSGNLRDQAILFDIGGMQNTLTPFPEVAGWKA